MRKIIFNKKFLAVVGICLSVAGGFAIKQKITTKASDNSFEVNGMNVSIQQCEGKSEEIMEEDLDETISNEVMALEEKGHNYEIGDTIETEEVAFVPMTKEIDDETAYNAFGTITSKSGNNYVIVVKSEKELTQDNLETVAEAVKRTGKIKHMIVEAEMILIKNARVMDPESGFDQVTDILLDGKRIRQIGKVDDVSGIEQVIDASGMIAAPGLIDVHVHFRDPGFTYKEDLQTGSAAAAAGGFTTVVCMANTKPVVDSVDIYKEIEDRCEQLPIKVWQAAAVSKGFEGKELTDMDALYEAGVRGFTDDGIPLMDEKLVEEAMKKAKELDVPISLHEEDPAYIKQPGVNQGKVSEQLNYGGASYLAEAVMVKRDCELAVKTGAKVDIQHISSGVAVDYVKEAKEKGANVYAEASPHHFTLTEEAVLKYGTLARMNPPLRTEEDRQRIIKGLQEGTIEIIATDHAPHSKEEKDKPLDQAPSALQGSRHRWHWSYRTCGERISFYDAASGEDDDQSSKLYNMEQGRLQEGKPADVVLFDPEEEWEVKEYKSKATNSPFTGWKLKGKVKYTICDGKIIEL